MTASRTIEKNHFKIRLNIKFLFYSDAFNGDTNSRACGLLEQSRTLFASDAFGQPNLSHRNELALTIIASGRCDRCFDQATDLRRDVSGEIAALFSYFVQ